jgi:hypothetical protein
MFSGWRRRLAAGVMFVLAGVMAGCGGGDESPTTVSGKVAGRALASADGTPVAGATVSAAGKSTTTAADGSYTLDGVPAADRVVVSFAAADYIGAIVPVTVHGDQTTPAHASMVRAAPAMQVDATADATVSAPGSTAAVDLVGNSLVDAATGAAATGSVSVRVTAIDPASDPVSMPGDYQTSTNGTIESFGAIQVQLQDASGRKLNLKPGSTATIRIPLASRSATPPASIPLYYLDETSGRWVQDGTATLKGSAPNAYYEGTVSHFSYWNADMPAETIYVHGCVDDGQGRPIYASVRSIGLDYSGTGYAATGADGKFSVAIRKNGRANIFAEDGINVSNTVEVGPATSDITLTTCLVIDGTPKAPVIVTQPSDYTTDEGSPAYFIATASGSRPISYQWRRNGMDIAGATFPFLWVPVVGLQDNGAVYSVVVTNSVASVTSQNATLTVNPGVAPNVVIPPTAQSVEAGQTATFSVVAAGSGHLSYQWQRNGVAIAGAQGASYTTPATALGDSGSVYRVVVSNAFGSATSVGALLTVSVPVPTAPSIETPPASVSVTAGQMATFGVVARGSAPLAYQWRKNGADIAGATSASYTTPATALTDNGAQFTVRVSNAQGNVTSDAATLTVTADTTSDKVKLMRLLSLSFQFLGAAMAPEQLVGDTGVFLASSAVCQSGSVSGTYNGSAIPVGTQAPQSGTLAATFSACNTGSDTYQGSSSLNYNLSSLEPPVGSATASVTNMRVTSNTGTGTQVDSDYTVNGSVSLSFAGTVAGADATSTFTVTPGASSTLRSEVSGLTAVFTSGSVALSNVTRGELNVSTQATYDNLRFTVDGVAYTANGSYQLDFGANGTGVVSGSGEVLLTTGGTTVGRIYANESGVFIEANGTVQAFSAQSLKSRQ